jgi:hypothetical protein
MPRNEGDRGHAERRELPSVQVDAMNEPHIRSVPRVTVHYIQMQPTVEVLLQVRTASTQPLAVPHRSGADADCPLSPCAAGGPCSDRG